MCRWSFHRWDGKARHEEELDYECKARETFSLGKDCSMREKRDDARRRGFKLFFMPDLVMNVYRVGNVSKMVEKETMIISMFVNEWCLVWFLALRWRRRSESWTQFHHRKNTKAKRLMHTYERKKMKRKLKKLNYINHDDVACVVVIIKTWFSTLNHF